MLGRPSYRRRLVAFLGGTIGNFTPEKRRGFLGVLRDRLRDGDRVLIGLDLVKDTRVLKAAYNYAAGVTARFNRNMIRVINLRLGANFDPDLFSHHATYDADRERIEMWLHSEAEQSVSTPHLEAHFGRGRTDRDQHQMHPRFSRPNLRRSQPRATGPLHRRPETVRPGPRQGRVERPAISLQVFRWRREGRLGKPSSPNPSVAVLVRATAGPATKS